jgi:N-acetylmuramoyl-L-alanine amidase
LKESMVVLAVALHMERLLLPYCDVVMTRREDRFLSLSGRAQYANVKNANLFVSVHCNAGPPGQGAGFEVWTSPGQMESDVAATHQFNAYADMFPMKPRRQDNTDGDPDKESKFTVLVQTRMAATLFELEFIHTTTGEEWLKQEKNQLMAAEALVDGILAHYGIVQELPEEEPRDKNPEPREEEGPPVAKPVQEPSADAAMMWQRMRAAGPLEAHIGLATEKDLIALRAFLSTQDPQGLIRLGLGMVENEMIERFIQANS